MSLPPPHPPSDLVLTSPHLLPLPPVIPEPSQPSELSSQRVPVPGPEVERPPRQKRVGGGQMERVTLAHTPTGYQLTSLIPLTPPRPPKWQGEMPSQSLPGFGVRLHQPFAFDLMSLASVSFLFPLPPPTPPHPYAPFNRHPLLLPSSFPPLRLGEGVLSPHCRPPSLLALPNTVP